MSNETSPGDRIAALEAKVNQLEAQQTRRGALRYVGAAAVGTAAGLLGSRPAVALDDFDLRLGQINYALSATFLRYGNSINSDGPLLTSERLMMWFDNRASTNTGAAGVRGDGRQTGYGVYGNNDFGGVGVQGRSSGTGPGVYARSEDGAAIEAGHGGTANMLLSPVNGPRGGSAETKIAPPDRSDAHERGELDVDSDGNLWFCTDAGTPGTWRKLAGPTTAGSLHAIDPVRSFDARLPAYPESGLLGPNSSKTIDISDGHDGAGVVIATDAVPAGATAVAFNATVTDTTGPNFISVVPGDALGFTTSTLNWTGAGQTVANSSISKLDDNRQLRIFSGDQSGSANVIIDTLGFFT